jgi:hypothetical protein
MNVNDYCKNVEQELTVWKARLYDANRKIETLPSNVKQQILGHMGGLQMIVADMEERIQKLSNECPTEWSPVKKEIDKGHVDMRSKYEETMNLIGKASPVSIAG